MMRIFWWDEVVDFLLKDLLLQVSHRYLRPCFVYVIGWIGKEVFVFEVIGLVKLRQFSVELEEEFDSSKDVEGHEVFEFDFERKENPFGDFVASSEVDKSDVEEGQSCAHNNQFEEDDLPFFPVTVDDENPEVAG